MRFGIWEIALIVLLIVILFGHSRIPKMMKSLASGITTFKKEMKKDDKSAAKNSKKESAKPTETKQSRAKKATKK